MKSESAKELIEKCCIVYGKYMPDNEIGGMRLILELLVNTTEKEAEKRVRRKAIEEHRKCCFLRNFSNDKCATGTKCGEHPCSYMNEFIQKLNDDETDKKSKMDN